MFKQQQQYSNQDRYHHQEEEEDFEEDEQSFHYNQYIKNTVYGYNNNNDHRNKECVVEFDPMDPYKPLECVLPNCSNCPQKKQQQQKYSKKTQNYQQQQRYGQNNCNRQTTGQKKQFETQSEMEEYLYNQFKSQKQQSSQVYHKNPGSKLAQNPFTRQRLSQQDNFMAPDIDEEDLEQIGGGQIKIEESLHAMLGEGKHLDFGMIKKMMKSMTGNSSNNFNKPPKPQRIEKNSGGTMFSREKQQESLEKMNSIRQLLQKEKEKLISHIKKAEEEKLQVQSDAQNIFSNCKQQDPLEEEDQLMCQYNELQKNSPKKTLSTQNIFNVIFKKNKKDIDNNNNQQKQLKEENILENEGQDNNNLVNHIFSQNQNPFLKQQDNLNNQDMDIFSQKQEQQQQESVFQIPNTSQIMAQHLFQHQEIQEEDMYKSPISKSQKKEQQQQKQQEQLEQLEYQKQEFSQDDNNNSQMFNYDSPKLMSQNKSNIMVQSPKYLPEIQNIHKIVHDQDQEQEQQQQQYEDYNQENIDNIDNQNENINNNHNNDDNNSYEQNDYDEEEQEDYNQDYDEEDLEELDQEDGQYIQGDEQYDEEEEEDQNQEEEEAQEEQNQEGSDNSPWGQGAMGGCRIKISNLNPSIGEQELKSILCCFGEMEQMSLQKKQQKQMQKNQQVPGMIKQESKTSQSSSDSSQDSASSETSIKSQENNNNNNINMNEEVNNNNNLQKDLDFCSNDALIYFKDAISAQEVILNFDQQMYEGRVLSVQIV